MTIKITHVHPTALGSDELSRRQAADMLQISPGGMEKLYASGYLPDLSAGRILNLARRPFLRADGVQPVLRQAPAQIDPDPEREYMGEGAHLTDAQQLDADRQWWRCDASQVVTAGLLPVTVAGFVVTVLRIEGIEKQVRRIVQNRDGDPAAVEVRWSFDATIAGRVRALGEPDRDYLAPGLEADERDAVVAMLAGRSSARSGGPIAYLPQVDS